MNTEIAFDRLPPHSTDAEQCLLGALLLADGDPVLFGDVLGLVRAEDFYQSDHTIIFATIIAMQRAGIAIDAVTLRERLISTGQLEVIGGVQFIAQLLNSVPSAAHARHYAIIVREKSIARALLHIGGEICQSSLGPLPANKTYTDMLNDFATRLNMLQVSRLSGKVRRLGEVMIDWLDHAANGKAPPVVATGYVELDDIIGGFPLGGFTQIGGRPGMGKSALAKCIALNVASGGTPVGLVSIEETEAKIAANAASNIGSIDSKRTRQATMTSAELASAQAVVDTAYHWPLFIADHPVALRDVEAAVAQMVHRHGCRLVFVDHLHIIDGGGGETRTVEVTNISKSLKALAKRLNIALVALCQLNRGTTRDEYVGRPSLRDWRDSGALEADGDVILGVFREDWNRQQRGDPAHTFDHQMLLIILKSKDSELGDVPLGWDGRHQRVEQWSVSYLPY